MQRFWGLSAIDNKTITALALALVALAASWLLLHRASAATDTNNSLLNTTAVKPLPFSESSASQGSSSNSSSTTKLSVNGQNIEVPANGSINQTISNQDGSTTTINAQSDSHQSTTITGGQTTSSSNNSVDIRVNSNGSASGSSEDSL